MKKLLNVLVILVLLVTLVSAVDKSSVEDVYRRDAGIGDVSFARPCVFESGNLFTDHFQNYGFVGVIIFAGNNKCLAYYN